MSKKFESEAGQTSPLAATPWDASDRAALMAVKECRATPEQQALFLAWFISATGWNELEFRVDERLSAFASGKKWVAQQFYDVCVSTKKVE